MKLTVDLFFGSIALLSWVYLFKVVFMTLLLADMIVLGLIGITMICGIAVISLTDVIKKHPTLIHS